MKLDLIRDMKRATNISTPGSMFIDTLFSYHTLELSWGDGANQHNKNCILPGTYEVTLDYSEHHQRVWPHILNVPDRDGIDFDIANYPSEIKGCIAVGLSAGMDYIGQSKVAWNDLYDRLTLALKKEKVYITITNQG